MPLNKEGRPLLLGSLSPHRILGERQRIELEEEIDTVIKLNQLKAVGTGMFYKGRRRAHASLVAAFGEDKATVFERALEESFLKNNHAGNSSAESADRALRIMRGDEE